MEMVNEATGAIQCFFKEETVKHLFEDWKKIQTKIQQAQNLFLFLDYDGTLTPIVSRPELALCPSEVKRHLEKLRDLPGVYLTRHSRNQTGS